MDWIHLDCDRDKWQDLINKAMNIPVPWNVGKFLTSSRTDVFSRMTTYR